MDADTRDAYLQRLGQHAEPPSVDALFRLHRAHAERVPWETLWIHLGDRWSTDLDESISRIASRRRGGYCFHLNGAFGELLRALGYDVTRHVGGVHGPGGASEAEMTNHLVLTVQSLPTDANPRGEWYVDVGLGDTLHEPLPLAGGEHRQGPYALLLEETSGAVGDWHLTPDPACSFAGMAWRSEPTSMDAFTDRHTWLSTSEDSNFVKRLVVQRRDASGSDILRGLTLLRVGDGASTATLETLTELIDALEDVFGLDTSDIGRAERDALWTSLFAKHEAWVAAGRP